ncbi:MAG: pyridoxal 5'-phosphate synthase glutaminase subunit PdxT [Dethiobacter sp.]|nr:MAG: pyridoxal 5'-phosphate synthase glutaminase subunit PdxT [Dethiobacter sp.]
MLEYEGKNASTIFKSSSFKDLKIGVLAIQGAVSEHMHSIEKCGARAVAVRNSSLLHDLDGLIIPGGESTTIGRLSRLYGFQDGICALVASGRPALGTCAGLILLAREVENQDPILSLMSINAKRNAFGRQRESFETDLHIPVLGEEPFRGVFIRAPLIVSVGEGVEILGRFQEYIVAVREKNLIATAFHPELTDDLRFHGYFLEMALQKAG